MAAPEKKTFEYATSILSLFIIPLFGWGIKLETDRAVHMEKIQALETAVSKKVGQAAFTTRVSTVDRQFRTAQEIKKDLVVIKVAQGRTEEKIDGIKKDLAALSRVVLTPAR